jgi:mxaJ protein
MVYGDYERTSPARNIVDAVANAEVDVAIVWGPIAGYFASQSPVPLALKAVSPRIDGPMLPMQFDISLGVRKDDHALRRVLDDVLARKHAEIRQLLNEYRVPLVEE